MKATVGEAHRAVMQVIEAESDAYAERDYEAWARCWVHAPTSRWWSFNALRGIYAWDWEVQSERVRRLMATDPEPSGARFRREAVNLHVGREIAWVTFDQYTYGATAPPIDLPEATSEMRVLEKDAEGWKIAFGSNFHRSFDYVTVPLVRVAEDGTVAWKNVAAMRDLGTTRGITVRAGRLRASERSVDQRLQAAFRWAAHLDDGVWPRRATLPIVLDGGRGEPANVCWVIARDGQILVAFNSRHMTEERIAAAAPVYGLTPAQMRLAGLVIDGLDVVGAAQKLGVSVNTARTQLKRMFEKTGVRSQAALVRALFSVAASPLST
jgi:DNA-binding CsgD family transcriptional regulator